MIPYLPSELIGLIIDELAVAGRGPWKGLLRDLKTCCMAARVFVPYCQKHIFRRIVLHPPRRTLKQSNVCQPYLTKRFSELVHQNPRLARYVQVLTYHASVHLDCSHPVIPFALGQMINVVEFNFSLVKVNDESTRSQRYCDEWDRAFSSLVYRPQLRVLRLKNVVTPADLLLSCIGLATLELEGTTFTWCSQSGSGEENRPVSTLLPTSLDKIYIRELSIGCDTMVTLDKLLKLQTHDSGRAFDFSRLIRLSVILEDMIDYLKIKPLLECSKCLQDLTIQADSSPDSAIVGLCLKSLEPSSLSTLVVLHLEISLEIGMDQWLLADPYFGLCDDGVLSDLTSLQELQLKLIVDDFDVSPSQLSFSHQWGQIDEIVSSNVESGWFTNFRVFDLEILLRIKELQPVTIQDAVDVAQGILDDLFTFVYPTQFPGLRRMSKMRRVKFSFKASMEVFECYSLSELAD